MNETRPTPEDAERAFWSWLGFWVQFLVLAVLAVVGAFFAAADARPGDYQCGLLLSLGAVAMACLRLKQQLDGSTSGGSGFMLVDDMKNLALAVPLFTIVGLAGLFIAHAWDYGSMHTAGLALFVVSGVIVFLDIKHVYDRMDSNAH